MWCCSSFVSAKKRKRGHTQQPTPAVSVATAHQHLLLRLGSLDDHAPLSLSRCCTGHRLWHWQAATVAARRHRRRHAASRLSQQHFNIECYQKLSNEDTCRLVWRFSQHARRTETVQSLLGEAVPLVALFGQRSHPMCTYLGLWMDEILQAWDKQLDIDWRVLLRYMPPAAGALCRPNMVTHCAFDWLAANHSPHDFRYTILLHTVLSGD
jgi:hypothetical protein